MKVVIQRVKSSSVDIDGITISSIGLGLTILVGVCGNDIDADLDWIVRKIINMRLFSDSKGLMNLSVKDVNGDILVVSQFTLFANCKKGNRPSFTEAASPVFAKNIYERLIEKMNNATGKIVKKGVFGADMNLKIENDGPVTIVLDSKL